MSVDWTKPIQTRDGRKARYICEIKAPPYSRLVILDDESNTESPEPYRENGGYMKGGEESILDIINSPPQPVTVEMGEIWVNVYSPTRRDVFGHAYKSKQEAIDAALNTGNYLGAWKVPATIQVERPE